MKMLMILPIITIVFIVIGIIMLKNLKLFSIPTNLKKYLVIIYLVVLLISSFSLNFVSGNKLTKYEGINAYRLNTPNLDNFKQLLAENKLDFSKDFIKKASYNFNYNKKENLEIRTTSNDVILVAEKKSVDDGKIEVMNYDANSYFNGTNITNKIKPPSITLTDNELQLLYLDNSTTQVKTMQFDVDFSTNQFINKTRYTRSLDYSASFGIKIIYIKIPKGLEITTSSPTGIEMIN